MAKIRVATLLFDSIVDGPGLRNVLFVQGCSHGCLGCHNPESWDPLGAQAIDTEEIIQRLLDHPTRNLTLSGGEPFEQAEALVEIVKELKKHQFNLWAYSGYTYERLIQGSPAQKKLLSYLDVLVDGPFILAKRSLSLLYRGSSNQRLINLNSTRKQRDIVLFQPDISSVPEKQNLYI